jgi:hypothetical protein
VILNPAEVRAIADAVDRAGLPSWRPVRDAQVQTATTVR